ncbi:MAG: OPT family oligopeptide transporter [Verrucomicrobiota bacterium]|nr:OPT/YSL family transporter [Limisphaera sp.]MDW8381585.1 OPT family oligopeptide transporter [Verrucomicrobiota bacterium]
MAIPQLTPEQIRTWTLEQKDRWWLEHVWRGNMPQLTWRAAITGMMLGGLLSLTNLYVGAKTGWTLGVGITSVILAFAMFKVLARLGLSREFTILENNCMQSIATAAGYMTAPLISSLAAYMMVTQTLLPMGMTLAWMVAVSVLGVLFAFPLKRRFINDEQHPFPEGRAAGIVMDALHSSGAQEGLFKARILVTSGALSALAKLMQSHAVMEKLRLGWMTLPEYLDEWIYRVVPLKIRGLDLRELTVRLDTDFVMMAAGGLMGIRVGVSLLVGAVVNYLILVPWAIETGAIQGRIGEDGLLHYGFRTITAWALWGGVAMMTTASLLAFFSKPAMVIGAFRGLFRNRTTGADVLAHIELPMWVFVLGIPLVGGVVVWMGHAWFGVQWWLGALAVPLVFLFTLIAVHSTALTSITPTGAMGKLTQLTYGVLDPGNIKSNLMTAGITAEVASNASNLLMDIKPGYMLGAKPRQQAIGHVLGILAGALVSVPVFYMVFLRDGPSELVQEQYPMPAATIWRSVAEALTQGLHQLPVTARWAALLGAVLGIIFEGTRIATRGRFWLSPVGLGLATVIPFNTCLAMFLGSLVFWLAERGTRPQGIGHRLLVQNQEPICGGVIAGGALMGIAVILLEQFVFSPR